MLCVECGSVECRSVKCRERQFGEEGKGMCGGWVCAECGEIFKREGPAYNMDFNISYRYD